MHFTTATAIAILSFTSASLAMPNVAPAPEITAAPALQNRDIFDDLGNDFSSLGNQLGSAITSAGGAAISAVTGDGASLASQLTSQFGPIASDLSQNAQSLATRVSGDATQIASAGAAAATSVIRGGQYDASAVQSAINSAESSNAMAQASAKGMTNVDLGAPSSANSNPQQTGAASAAQRNAGLVVAGGAVAGAMAFLL